MSVTVYYSRYNCPSSHIIMYTHNGFTGENQVRYNYYIKRTKMYNFVKYVYNYVYSGPELLAVVKDNSVYSSYYAYPTSLTGRTARVLQLLNKHTCTNTATDYIYIAINIIIMQHLSQTDLKQQPLATYLNSVQSLPRYQTWFFVSFSICTRRAGLSAR